MFSKKELLSCKGKLPLFVESLDRSASRFRNQSEQKGSGDHSAVKESLDAYRDGEMGPVKCVRRALFMLRPRET